MNKLFVCIFLTGVFLAGCHKSAPDITYDASTFPDEYRLELRRIPQNDNYSCATTSLATIISFYQGLEEPLDKDVVWEISQTEIRKVRKYGNDVEGLNRIAHHYTYEYSFMEYLSFDDLRYFITHDTPVILFIRVEGNYTHALVVNGYNRSKKVFYITDPSSEHTILPESFLETHWEAWLWNPRKKSRRAGYVIRSGK